MLMRPAPASRIDEHFAAFSFVDRIAALDPGKSARGVFAIPEGIREFPRALVAEAVGQLAAWVAMSHIEFRGRPVAALAAETSFFDQPRPGQTLDLEVLLSACDDEAVAYGGWARIQGQCVAELADCLGPMLPAADFDSPDALRQRFALLCAEGAPPHRFGGVELERPEVTAHVAGQSVRATLRVPDRAPFFADHFPRRPVFPATLLLDAQMHLAARLADESPLAASGPLSLRRMSNVKVRSFTTPGQSVELSADATPRDDGTLRVALAATFEGRTVATSRVEFAPGPCRGPTG
jgi:3-hydroxymyristoyl/3-hydroxydecanoyl-(acyl carrier protein) dehydratase